MQLNHTSVPWNRPKHVLHMALKHVNVPKLRSHKIRSKHVSGMLPCRTVGGEDTFAEKRDQELLASLAELEGLEICG